MKDEPDAQSVRPSTVSIPGEPSSLHPCDRSVFLADLHLSPARPQGGEAFVRFVNEQHGRIGTLYIMGDLFDYWIGPEHLRLPDYRRELNAIRGLARSGVRVVMFKGNRDFYFQGLQRALGVEVVSDHLVETFGSTRTYLCHGDLLCAGDHRYQRARRFLRSHLVSAIACSLPAWLALRLASGAREVSRKEVARKTMDSMDLCPRTLAKVFAGRGDLARRGLGRDTGDVDALVCGHIHRPAVRSYTFGGRARTVYVLGPWDAGPCHLEFANDRFRLIVPEHEMGGRGRTGDIDSNG